MTKNGFDDDGVHDTGYASKGKESKYSPPSPKVDLEAMDAEYSEKKDRPPRFSTLFGTDAPLPLPPRPLDLRPPPRRRSGVWLPMPLFVLLIIILFFESTILFVYTLVGLFNNIPVRLVHTTAGTCDCPATQPGINIAPNFMMPQAQAPVVQTVTMFPISNLPEPQAVSSASPSTKTTTTVSATNSTATGATSQTSAAAAASELLGIFQSIARTSSTTSPTPNPGVATSTLVLSEVPPPPSTVNVVTYVTVNAAGSSIPPRSTVTSVTVIDPAQATALSSSLAASVAAESSSQAQTPDSASSNSSALPITPSTVTAAGASVTAPPSTSPAPAPSSTAKTSSKAVVGFCVGGAGAVQQDCIQN